MKGMTRRRFLQYSAGAGVGLALPWAARTPVASAAPGLKLTKYLEPVPLPGAGIVVATSSGTNEYSFVQREISRQLHPQLPPTPLWAYDDGSGLAGQAGSFGMALVAQTGKAVRASFTNSLPETYPAWIPVDTRLTPLGNQVRLMTHLHGGFVAADSDGNPAITPNGFGGAQMWQIGAEGGMWDQPVPVRQLVLAPAERADVLVDFRRSPGQTLVVKNSSPPRPVVTPAPSLATVMQLRVGATVSQPGPSTIPASLPGRAANLPAPTTTRYITLNEIGVDTAGWFLNLNGLHFEDAATETPTVGTVEDWVYVNLTGDTHPMHTHLFTHQVIGRTPFNVEAYEEAAEAGPDGVPGGIDPTPFATGPMQPPAPEERGFKDTTKANPGYFTTIRGKFDLPTGVTVPQTYVHHCHIVEHEDNDMMRPFTVIP